MNDFVMPLPLALDVQSLAMGLVNIESPRGAEEAIADSIEAALSGVPQLAIQRTGDTVIARAAVAGAPRIVIVGRIDAPATEEEPLAFVEMGKLFGPGAAGAKGSVAVLLKVAASGALSRDVTLVLHDGSVDPLASDDALRALTGDDAVDLVLLATPTGSAVVGADLTHPLAEALVALTDAPTLASVAALDAVAVSAPVIAFGPGDAAVAGTDGEFVPTAELGQCEFVLRRWLTA